MGNVVTFLVEHQTLISALASAVSALCSAVAVFKPDRQQPPIEMEAGSHPKARQVPHIANATLVVVAALVSFLLVNYAISILPKGEISIDNVQIDGNGVIAVGNNISVESTADD